MDAMQTVQVSSWLFPWRAKYFLPGLAVILGLLVCWAPLALGQLPSEATSPNPPDGATEVSLTPELSWSAGSDAEGHSINFGTINPPPASSTSQTENIFLPGMLLPVVTYYWSVDEINSFGVTPGPVWSFTTQRSAMASQPDPPAGAADVALDAQLSWQPGVGATAHVIHFGDTVPIPFATTQTTTLFDPGPLMDNHTYYWRVNEVNADGLAIGYIWYFTTMRTPSATQPNPPDGATSVPLDAKLSWQAGQGVTTHSVYFGDTDPPAFVGEQTTTNFDPGPLLENHTYYWRVDEIGVNSVGQGAVWRFTTALRKPAPASNPNPSDGAMDIGLNITLSWTPSIVSQSRDVYFGDVNPPPFRGNQTAVTYDPGPLEMDRTYYWRVDEKNVWGTAQGAVWTFSTLTPAPGPADLPDPPDGALLTNVTPTLRWAPGIHAARHAIHFGLTNPPPFVTTQTAPVFSPGALQHSRTYYWRIDEHNGAGMATGAVWSFQTPPLDLAGYWKLDETEGATAADSSGNGNDGDVTGAAQWIPGGGMYGGALRFNGADTATSIPALNLDGSSVTITAWVNLNGAQANQAGIVFCRAGTTVAGLTVRNGGGYNNTLRYVWNNGAIVYPSNLQIPASEWAFVALVVEPSTGTLYLRDAVSMKTQTNRVAHNAQKFDGVVYLGFDPGAALRRYDGDLDEVRIYNRALSAEEIDHLYSLGGPATNPDPPNGATGVSTSPLLSWQAAPGAASHDVYFGADAADVANATTASSAFMGNQTISTFAAGPLNENQTYYWRIDECDASGAITGAVWSFTTLLRPPDPATAPNPADHASGVSTATVLSWTPGARANRHIVYLGLSLEAVRNATTTSPEYRGVFASAAFTPTSLDGNRIYYWRVDEAGAGGVTPGAIWSFTTVVGVPDTAALTVDVWPLEASWTFMDAHGAAHSGTGPAALSNLPPGASGFLWNPLVSFDAPPENPVAMTLANETTQAVTGVYTRQSGVVFVDANPSSASWSLMDGQGQVTTGTGVQTLTGVAGGQITLTWNSLSGYDEPSTNPQVAILTKFEPVTFAGDYIRQLGAAVVTATPAAAAWILIDGDGRITSGTGSQTVTSVPTGLVTLIWDPLPNYDSPSTNPQTGILAKNAQVNFSGVFTRQRGTVILDVTPDVAPWTLTDGDGHITTGTGDWITSGVPTGRLSVKWANIPLYNTPAPNPQVLILAKDGQATFVGAYVRRAGTVVVQVTPDAAPWSLMDGAGNVTTGTGDCLTTGVATGLIKLTWEDLPYWDLPSTNPEVALLMMDAVTTITGVYTRQRGTVEVEVTPSSASWSFTDSDGGLTSGTGNQTITDVLAGPVMLTWQPLPKYDEPLPSSETLILGKNETVRFTGAYIRQSGTVVVDVTPDTASWVFTDADGGLTSGIGSQTIPNVPAGPVTLTWQPLPGYDEPLPSSEMLILGKNEIVQFTGAYQRHRGTVAVDVTPDSAWWVFTDADGGVTTGTGDRITTGVPTGEIILSWLPLANYVAPDSPTSAILIKDGVTTFTGVYIPNPSPTPSPTPMQTATPQPTPTMRPTPTIRPTPSGSPTPTMRPTPTLHPTATAAPTPTATPTSILITGVVRTRTSVAVTSVVLSTSDGKSSATTDANGAYTLIVPSLWSGFVTPSKTGYTFNPPQRAYLSLAANQQDQDYEAALTVQWLTDYLSGRQTASPEDIRAADINGDGRVDMSDLIWLISHGQ